MTSSRSSASAQRGTSLLADGGSIVNRPRHFLISRREAEVLIIGRVLHDAMELRRHVDPQPWE